MSEQDAELEDERDIGIDELEDEDDIQVEADDPDLVEDDALESHTPPAKQPSRSQREIIKLRKRTQEAEDRARRAEETSLRNQGAIETLTRQPQTGPTAAERQAEAERLANMSPQELVDYRLNQEKQLIGQAFRETRYKTDDTLDALRFERLCDKNPAYAGVAEEVDRRVEDLKRQGITVPRKTIADIINGERVAQKGTKTGRKTQEATERHRARAPGARSDVAADRGGRGAPKTARERLEALEAKGINPFNSRR